MVERESSIRPLPLKVAGAIGAFAAVLYLASPSLSPRGSPGHLLVPGHGRGRASRLVADQFPGRRAAIAAAILFFVLGILSPLFLAVAFLVAVSLCVIGFVEFGSR